ncbi:dTMP kinase [bacterium]|nr:dTMP kinase [bacterium]
MQKGLFITFEGCDGCGKSTQLNLLAKYLEEKGYNVLITREPGAVGLGEKIRELLLNYDDEVSQKCESFLFLADRAQHIDTIVKPAIERGVIVLCDRHTDSTIAYQGYGRGLNIDELNKLNTLATGGMKPDLTLLFDVDSETSMQRVGQDKDRMESAGIEFQKKVRNGYLELAKNEPNRIKVFDSSKTIEQLHQEVLSTVQAVLQTIISAT